MPFYPQEAYQCGPASLASVLNFWNVQVTPEEIARDIYSSSAKGTLNLDMLSYARKRGLNAKGIRASLDDLKRSVDEGKPVIVLLDVGFWVYEKGHYVVMVGYSEDHLIVNSGRDTMKRMTVESFERAWERAGFWALFIEPK